MKRKLNTAKTGISETTAATLIVAVALLGLLAGASLQPAKEPEKELTPVLVNEFDMVQIPVPLAPVPAGVSGKEIALTMMDFPAHQVPLGALRDIADYHDAIARHPLPARIPLFPENFSFEKSLPNPVMSRIPEGMRAITLYVDVASAVEGWAGSGSHVDVLLVEDDKTTVIAENVEILSAERSVTPVEGDSPSVPRTVTILVNQYQALAIATAVPRGRLAFALRPPDDSGGWSQKVFNASHLVGAARVAAPAEVSGYVKFTDEEGNRKGFALSDGRWIKAHQIPAGILVGRDKNE